MKENIEAIKKHLEELRAFKLQDHAYNGFKRVSEKIDDLIRSWIEVETDEVLKIKLQEAATKVTHTIGDEVWSIKFYEDKLRSKRNRTKPQIESYHNSIEKAYDEMYSGVYVIINLE